MKPSASSRAHPDAIRHAKHNGSAEVLSRADAYADRRTSVQLGDVVGLVVESALLSEQSQACLRRALAALDNPKLARSLAEDRGGIRQEALSRVLAMFAFPDLKAA